MHCTNEEDACPFRVPAGVWSAKLCRGVSFCQSSSVCCLPAMRNYQNFHSPPVPDTSTTVSPLWHTLCVHIDSKNPFCVISLPSLWMAHHLTPITSSCPPHLPQAAFGTLANSSSSSSALGDLQLCFSRMAQQYRRCNVNMSARRGLVRDRNLHGICISPVMSDTSTTVSPLWHTLCVHIDSKNPFCVISLPSLWMAHHLTPITSSCPPHLPQAAFGTLANSSSSSSALGDLQLCFSRMAQQYRRCNVNMSARRGLVRDRNLHGICISPVMSEYRAYKQCVAGLSDSPGCPDAGFYKQQPWWFLIASYPCYR